MWQQVVQYAKAIWDLFWFAFHPHSRKNWLDEGDYYDVATSLWFGWLAALYLTFIGIEPNAQSSLFQLLSSSCANILGFIAATLTIVSSFGHDLVGAFTMASFKNLFREFKKAFFATLFCFVFPMIGLVAPLARYSATAVCRTIGRCFFEGSLWTLRAP